nr:unnamed protein product [Callosobruchus analis]
MSSCAVGNCKDYSRVTKGNNIKYLRFPKDENIAKKMDCCLSEILNLRQLVVFLYEYCYILARICSVHFEKNCFEVPLKERLLNCEKANRRHLKPDPISTLILPKNYKRPRNASKEREGERKENKEEIDDLRKKIRILEEENNELRRKVKEAEISTEQRYEATLLKVFTKGQIKKLKCSAKDKRIRWSPEDITSAISLRSVSPKAYRYLKVNNYPLPALSTLRKWVTDFEIQEGFLENVISLMKTKAGDFNPIDRLCVLSLDEMYISKKVDIDKKVEGVVGPHKSCKTVMVRGL